MSDAALPTHGIRLTPIPRLAQGGRWRIEAMRSYSSDLLLWFTRGQGRITVAGSTRGYGSHNAVFIPAGTMHGFDMGASVFGTAVFLNHGLNLGFPKQHLHLRVRDGGAQTELTAALEAIQREIDGKQPDSARALYHQAGLLAVWITRAQKRYAVGVVGSDKAESIAARYTQMVEDEFRSGRSVSDYAAALGITPTHLTRVCNQSCGRSASALLTDRILFEARRLLRETRLPVQQVSAQLGYTTPAYFSRVFHNYIGKTPTEFRRER